MAEAERPPGAGASKDEWRVWARTTARSLDWPALSARTCRGLRTFPPLRHGGTVLTYLAMDDEIDVSSLIETQPSNRWLATRTPEEGPLTVHELGGPLELHPFGFRQPAAGSPLVDLERIDIVLVPGVAFDLYGQRLGHGAGYYDELLSRLPAHTVRIGVAPAALVADRLPVAPHDESVQWIAAEEGVIGVVVR